GPQTLPLGISEPDAELVENSECDRWNKREIVRCSIKNLAPKLLPALSIVQTNIEENVCPVALHRTLDNLVHVELARQIRNGRLALDRKSTRLNSSHQIIS